MSTVAVPDVGSGYLEISEKGFGFLRTPEAHFHPKPTDVFVTPDTIKKAFLREGCLVAGALQPPHRGSSPQMKEVTSVNGVAFADYTKTILIVAYVTPVAILSYNVTGNPVPQLVYGQVLQQVTELENRLFDSPAEVEVRQLFKERADQYAQKIMQLPHSLTHEREQLSTQINQMKSSDAQMKDIVALERQRRDLPHDPEQAKVRWESAMYSAADQSSIGVSGSKTTSGSVVSVITTSASTTEGSASVAWGVISASIDGATTTASGVGCSTTGVVFTVSSGAVLSFDPRPNQEKSPFAINDYSLAALTARMPPSLAMTEHKLGVILPPFPAFNEETPWRVAKLPLLVPPHRLAVPVTFA